MAAPTRKYMEDALLAVKDYLDDNLNTMLATIRSERGSTDTPPNPGVISKGRTMKNLFPKVQLLPDTSPHDYGDQDYAAFVEAWVVHNIVISVTHRSANVDIVEDTLLRYSEAINRLQEDDDTFGNAFVWVRIRDEDWSPMITSQEERQMTGTLIVPIECSTT